MGSAVGLAKMTEEAVLDGVAGGEGVAVRASGLKTNALKSSDRPVVNE